MLIEALESDVQKATGILSTAKKPVEVFDFKVTPGETSTGEPALWIDLFVVHEEIEPRRITEIVDFIQATRDRMILSGLKAWPFLRITGRPD